MDEKRPLLHKTILITRAKAQGEKFAKQIKEAGGVPIIAPLLKIVANDENIDSIKSIVTKLSDFDSIVFTSTNGVHFFKQYLDRYHIPFQLLNEFIIAAVGSKTRKEIEKFGVSVEIMPNEFVAEQLASEITSKLQKQSKVLIVRGNLARPVLIEHLCTEQFIVKDLVVYNTLYNDVEQINVKNLLKEDKLDFITFTSPSTVHSFMKAVGQEAFKAKLEKLVFICIGPITNNALKEYGFHGLMPIEYTTDKMVELMESTCIKERNING